MTSLALLLALLVFQTRPHPYQITNASQLPRLLAQLRTPTVIVFTSKCELRWAVWTNRDLDSDNAACGAMPTDNRDCANWWMQAYKLLPVPEGIDPVMILQVVDPAGHLVSITVDEFIALAGSAPECDGRFRVTDYSPR